MDNGNAGSVGKETGGSSWWLTWLEERGAPSRKQQGLAGACGNG